MLDCSANSWLDKVHNGSTSELGNVTIVKVPVPQEITHASIVILGAVQK